MYLQYVTAYMTTYETWGEMQINKITEECNAHKKKLENTCKIP